MTKDDHKQMVPKKGIVRNKVEEIWAMRDHIASYAPGEEFTF